MYVVYDDGGRECQDLEKSSLLPLLLIFGVNTILRVGFHDWTQLNSLKNSNIVEMASSRRVEVCVFNENVYKVSKMNIDNRFHPQSHPPPLPQNSRRRRRVSMSFDPKQRGGK